MITRKCLWTLLCVALLILVSCVKAPELTFTGPSSIELSVDGSSGSITFTANRDWTVNCSDTWVSVSPSSGTASDGTVTVTVRCNANTTYEDRTATVTIRMEELSRTVTVRQPANLGIVLPTQSFVLTSDARSIEVEVQANIQYSIETSVDWIRQPGTKGLSSTKYVFSIEKNETYDDREGKIIIKPQNSNVAEQLISVKQAQKDAIIVKDTAFDMPYGGGEIEFKVEANVAFDVGTDADWIHYVSTKALSTSTVKLKVDDNPTFSARSGKVEVTQQGGSLKHTITVNQAGRIAVTSIELDKTSLTLKPEETASLVATVKPDNATDKTVTWTSSDSSIASVDANGKVTAIKDGTATITAKAGEKSATCSVTVISSVYVGNAVDLGIVIIREDGTAYNLQWADCNLGIDKPEEFGDYYAWGETETKDIYNWSTYKFRTSGDSSTNVKFSKYNTLSSYGPVDNKTVLDTEDDVAQVKLGGKWRIPTQAEQETLRDQCTWTWTTKNGVNGYEVKSKVNSNSIFLPAAGCRNGTSLVNAGTYGLFWSSSVTSIYPCKAYCIVFDSDNVNWESDFRFLGFTVRPVKETEQAVTSIELNKTILDLWVGETETLVATVKAGDITHGTAVWSSSNPEVASVDNSGKVTAIKEGSATITAKAGEKKAECEVTVKSSVYVGNAVDLGIVIIREDGTAYNLQWADCNLGASNPEEFGEYYAWGEVRTKQYYFWNTYIWDNGDAHKLTKYCPADKSEYWDGEGAPDNKIVLDLEDDVANVRLGGKWRVPTKVELESLQTQCTKRWTTMGDTKGYELRSNTTNNCIFLPASGRKWHDSYMYTDSLAFYTSSSLYTETPYDAYMLEFGSDHFYVTTSGRRCSGKPVRPVLEVEIPVSSIELNKTNLDMKVGETETLVATVKAGDITHGTAVWSSSNPEVAYVDNAGKVTAIKAGSATITAKAGEKTASCKVTVCIPVTSVELNKTTLNMKVGDTETLVATVKPDNATDKTVTWTSSDASIASVDANGKVTAIKDGTATITARAGEKSATCTVTVKTPEYVGNAVDLGITITRSDGTTYNLQWADCNLGTDKPEEFGDYYAWGETETKDIYTWETYKFRTSGDNWDDVKFSKYNTSSSYGPVDNKTVLDPEDDVAHVKLGGKWRMPTKAEQDALRTQCTWTWTTLNGVNGYIVESKSNGNSIFLPAAGSRYGTNLSHAGSYGDYWSSSLNTGYPNGAWYVYFYSDYAFRSSSFRYYGLSVRPVTE